MVQNQNKMWSKEDLISFKSRWRAVTIPINVQVDIKQSTLFLENVLQIIELSEKIAVTDCICRTKLQNCDFPRKVCLSLGKSAIKSVSEGIAEYISKDEAKSIVMKTHETGLVHLALHRPEDYKRNIQAICSCCSCCCHALQGLLLMNMQGLVKGSEYISIHDQERCMDCGECVDRCQFSARKLDDKNLMIFDPNLCFGCGLCVTSCPQDAIKMIIRPLV